MKFYTYILRSKKDKRLYIGSTNNLSRRVAEHSEGKVDSTEHRRPLKLIYCECFGTREAAVEREKYFKSGSGREKLRQIITD